MQMNCQNENRFLTLEQIFITTNTCTGMYPSITGVKICVSNKNSIEMQRNCQNVNLFLKYKYCYIFFYCIYSFCQCNIYF